MLSEHSQLISWIVCAGSGTGESQGQTAGYLSACEPVEGVHRALPELLTHHTHCTLGEHRYACSRVIRHGRAPPVRLECGLISQALAELGAAAVFYLVHLMSAHRRPADLTFNASVSTLRQTKSR